ncbi:MAG: glycerol-3-phosphate 1-O-acyltransferase PlsY [Nitrospirota bacterium]
MEIIFKILFIAGSYAIGSIPFGLLFSKIFSKIDVRSVGSGNIGATNVLRASGKKAALLTLLADALKGYVPVLCAHALFHDEYVTVMTGAATILGHNFSMYLSFSGGKGVATGYGIMLAITPWIGFCALLVWLFTALVSKYSSLSALVSYALYPVLIFTTTVSKPFQLLSVFLFGLIYYRHRENIKRLLLGTESKIGEKKNA